MQTESSRYLLCKVRIITITQIKSKKLNSMIAEFSERLFKLDLTIFLCAK